MSDTKQPCHGKVDGLVPCSGPLHFSRPYKLWWRLRLALNHLRGRIQDDGLWKTLGYGFRKLLGLIGIRAGKPVENEKQIKQQRDDEALNLQPGEWVEVKSEQEILATLDENSKYKGLRWMCNMRKFCGSRYRVLKRLETMLLESSGEYRKVKNTVLLEGVICDGQDWFGCDRSCYHFWREVWLRRVEPPDKSDEQGSKVN